MIKHLSESAALDPITRVQHDAGVSQEVLAEYAKTADRYLRDVGKRKRPSGQMLLQIALGGAMAKLDNALKAAKSSQESDAARDRFLWDALTNIALLFSAFEYTIVSTIPIEFKLRDSYDAEEQLAVAD